MLSDSAIYVPVWLALVGWFIGSFARAHNAQCPGGQHDAIYRFSWLFGSVMVALHILTSYGIAHGWSHAAAVEATAVESEKVTGIRAGWGVYVNFAFVVVWMGYSIAMVSGGRRWPGIDQAVFWFTAAIIVSATIVFESGAVRWIATAGLICLLVMSLWPRLSVADRRSASHRPK